MNKKLFYLILLVTMAACSQVMITGRKQLSLVSDADVLTMGLQSYHHFIDSVPLSTNKANTDMVKRVGRRISGAVEEYLRNNGQEAELKNFAWEYNLVKDPSVNAFCMPGGKIVIYTGILQVTKDDSGLATVMGHEVAHALANHGAQRMSASQLQQLGAVGVGLATGGKSEQQQQMWQQYYGLGSQVGVMLPFGRGHESEADMVGLTLMAIAGYNPDNAVAFWERMAAKSGGNAPPEFLSTHPSDATRIAKIKQLIPEAKATAKKFGVVYK